MTDSNKIQIKRKKNRFDKNSLKFPTIPVSTNKNTQELSNIVYQILNNFFESYTNIDSIRSNNFLNLLANSIISNISNELDNISENTDKNNNSYKKEFLDQVIYNVNKYIDSLLSTEFKDNSNTVFKNEKNNFDETELDNKIKDEISKLLNDSKIKSKINDLISEINFSKKTPNKLEEKHLNKNDIKAEFNENSFSITDVSNVLLDFKNELIKVTVNELNSSLKIEEKFEKYNTSIDKSFSKFVNLSDNLFKSNILFKDNFEKSSLTSINNFKENISASIEIQTDKISKLTFSNKNIFLNNYNQINNLISSINKYILSKFFVKNGKQIKDSNESLEFLAEKTYVFNALNKSIANPISKKDLTNIVNTETKDVVSKEHKKINKHKKDAKKYKNNFSRHNKTFSTKVAKFANNFLKYTIFLPFTLFKTYFNVFFKKEKTQREKRASVFLEMLLFNKTFVFWTSAFVTFLVAKIYMPVAKFMIINPYKYVSNFISNLVSLLVTLPEYLYNKTITFFTTYDFSKILEDFDPELNESIKSIIDSVKTIMEDDNLAAIADLVLLFVNLKKDINNSPVAAGFYDIGYGVGSVLATWLVLKAGGWKNPQMLFFIPEVIGFMMGAAIIGISKLFEPTPATEKYIKITDNYKKVRAGGNPKNDASALTTYFAQQSLKNFNSSSNISSNLAISKMTGSLVVSISNTDNLADTEEDSTMSINYYTKKLYEKGRSANQTFVQIPNLLKEIFNFHVFGNIIINKNLKKIENGWVEWFTNHKWFEKNNLDKDDIDDFKKVLNIQARILQYTLKSKSIILNQLSKYLTNPRVMRYLSNPNNLNDLYEALAKDIDYQDARFYDSGEGQGKGKPSFKNFWKFIENLNSSIYTGSKNVDVPFKLEIPIFVGANYENGTLLKDPKEYKHTMYRHDPVFIGFTKENKDKREKILFDLMFHNSRDENAGIINLSVGNKMLYGNLYNLSRGTPITTYTYKSTHWFLGNGIAFSPPDYISEILNNQYFSTMGYPLEFDSENVGNNEIKYYRKDYDTTFEYDTYFTFNQIDLIEKIIKNSSPNLDMEDFGYLDYPMEIYSNKDTKKSFIDKYSKRYRLNSDPYKSVLFEILLNFISTYNETN